MSVWAPDGSALYWVSDDGKMMEATFGEFSSLFDVAPDGRFLMIRPERERWQPDRVRVVVNWFEELNRLVPVE